MLYTDKHTIVSRSCQLLLQVTIVILSLNAANTSLLAISDDFPLVEVEEEVEESRFYGLGAVEVEKLNDTITSYSNNREAEDQKGQYIIDEFLKLNPCLEIHSPPPEA